MKRKKAICKLIGEKKKPKNYRLFKNEVCKHACDYKQWAFVSKSFHLKNTVYPLCTCPQAENTVCRVERTDNHILVSRLLLLAHKNTFIFFKFLYF